MAAMLAERAPLPRFFSRGALALVLGLYTIYTLDRSCGSPRCRCATTAEISADHYACAQSVPLEAVPDRLGRFRFCDLFLEIPRSSWWAPLAVVTAAACRSSACVGALSFPRQSAGLRHPVLVDHFPAADYVDLAVYGSWSTTIFTTACSG